MPKMRDYTGMRINYLAALHSLGKRKSKRGHMESIWLFQCDCGNTVEEVPARVACGTRKSCGCRQDIARRQNIKPAKPGERRRPISDITGQRFGRLTAIRMLEERAASGNLKWMFRCDCGNEKAITASNVRSESGTRSCGCLFREAATRNAALGRASNIAKAKMRGSRILTGLLPGAAAKIKPRKGRIVSICHDE